MKIITNVKHLSKKCISLGADESQKVSNKMRLWILSKGPLMENVVGIACNQLGLPGRVFLYKKGATWKDVINPEIISYSDDTVVGPEKCLSVPNKWMQVRRSVSITISVPCQIVGATPGLCVCLEEEVTGADAILFQHEIDHLDGKLIGQDHKEVILEGDVAW
jgi:peptide deformylase